MIDDSARFRHASGMLSKPELLAAVREAAPSLADIARVLSLPPARITEIFQGKRDVSFDEARRLIKHYNIPHSDVSAAFESASDAMKEIGISLVPEIDISLSMGAEMSLMFINRWGWSRSGQIGLLVNTQANLPNSSLHAAMVTPCSQRFWMETLCSSTPRKARSIDRTKFGLSLGVIWE